MRTGSIVLSGFLLFQTLSASGPAWAADPEPGSRAALRQRFEELDRTLQARLRRLANQAAAGKAADPDLVVAAEGLRRRLDDLEHAAREQAAAWPWKGRVVTGESRPWRSKLRQLRRRVENLERAARSVAALPRSGFDGAGGSLQLKVGESGTIAGTVTDAATGAPLPGGYVEAYDSQGYYIGSASTDSAGQYVVAGLGADSYYLVTKSFEGYVDELYDGLACFGGANDGCQPLDGTAVVLASGGQQVGVDFTLDRGGEIRGTVVRATGATPLAGLNIETYDENGSQVATDFTANDGTYVVAGLAAGNYYVVAESSEFRDEVFADTPCTGSFPDDCDPTAGTPIKLELAATSRGVDFVLDELGSISGVVTRKDTAGPADMVRIELYRDVGSGFSYVHDGYTDSAGAYRIGGLAAGTYVVRTDDVGTYVNEVYDGFPCCDLAAGTPIAVALNAPVTGIDFDLDAYGRLSGTVTDALTGDPLAVADVEIRNAAGGWVGVASTDYAGRYTSEPLSPADYVLNTDVYDRDHLNELYDDVPCPDGVCDPAAGTPVSALINKTTSGVDFTLEKGGIVSGTVANTDGALLPSYRVLAFDAVGNLVADDYTDSSGVYAIGGLYPGTFYVATGDFDGYRNELYEDLPCHPSCDRTAGTPLVLDVNVEVTGIDFALDRLGSISGRVTEASGLPVPSGHIVGVYDPSGNVVGLAATDSSGFYRVQNLAPGSYYVSTERDGPLLDELYDDLPCEPTCDRTTGTPVPVALSENVTGIDFVLERRGSISGSVTDSDGQAIANVEVTVYDETGSFLGTSLVYADGTYKKSNLVPGSYFVKTHTYYGDYLDEVYDDVPCASSCDVTTGTPIAVGVAEDVTGIDIVLAKSIVVGAVGIFADGFESGDVSIWSGNFGVPP